MSPILLVIVSLIYFSVGVIDYLNKDFGMGLCFFSYGIANIGLILAARGV